MIRPDNQMQDLRKQAYYDSHLTCRDNINKYMNYSDPILQKNEYYVSNYLFI